MGHFFIEEADEWFFKGYDLLVDYDPNLEEPTYHFKNNKKERVTQFLSPSLFLLKILFSAINILQTILLDWFEAHGWQSSFSDWLKNSH